MFERSCILIGRIGPKHALGSNEGVTAHIGSTKTAGKGSETVFRKAHHYRGHFLYALEALIPIVASDRENLGWFRTKQVAGRVNAIDPHVVDRAAPARHRFTDANIIVRHLLRKLRGKNPQSSQF